MKAVLTQENLMKALNTVSRVANSRTTLPILSNILIKTEDGKLVLAATNLEVAIIEKIPAKIERDGVSTAPAKLITEFISNLPKTNVEINTSDNKITIKAGNYRSVVNTVIADEFPALPEPKNTTPIKIPANIFKKAVAGTALVTSNDTTRPILTGVYLHTMNGDLYMAATDGYRLAEKKLLSLGKEVSAIVPASTLNDVVRIISDETEEIIVSFSDDQISFIINDATVTSRLIDGNFIDYRQLIPKKTDVVATLDRSEFIRITKISELFARESAGSITLKVDSDTSSLKIHSITSELGENDSIAEATVKSSGVITLNSKFLLDALNQIDGDSVKFQFSGKLAPALLTSDSDDTYKHIIMPVKS
ncbi:MAG: DNA polymerase III subunit beta [Candidatus Nomurabacteria bacterium]|jgi:DNA polymerase-3 subunit beta|nr:DNA polymerase III subunit beta [Candidatus Nomurabacteria bacterium]